MQEEKENNEVTLSSRDIDNIKAFFSHFGIPVPEYLQNEITRFTDLSDKGSYTMEMQMALRAQLSRALVTAQNPIMEDELFKGILNKCNKVWFDAQFEADLEEALSQQD